VENIESNSDSNTTERRSLLAGGLGLALGGLGAAVLGPGQAAAAPHRPLAEGERYIAVPGGRVWINVVGRGRGTPVLLIPGGPGAASPYLESFATLADDRPVIFYDPLGSGESEHPDNVALWTMERSVAELVAVRKALGLDKVHLFGHSFGAWLIIEYLQRRPKGVVSGVLASGSGSAAEYNAGARRLRAQLPRDVQKTLDHYEALGDTTAPEYLAAVQVYYDRHFFRGPVMPDVLARSLASLSESPLYATMNGLNEMSVTGNLATWDRRSRLGVIREPMLLTRGRYDTFEVSCMNNLQARLPRTERAEFPNSGHLAMLEDERPYLAVLRKFLRRHDREC
jgi:proline iminopeptidase